MSRLGKGIPLERPWNKDKPKVGTLVQVKKSKARKPGMKGKRITTVMPARKIPRSVLTSTTRRQNAATYKGVELVDIPSGVGGVLPAAVAKRNADGTTQVICLHPEFYPNWVLTVKNSDVKPFSFRLTEGMKKIVDSRLSKKNPRRKNSALAVKAIKAAGSVLTLAGRKLRSVAKKSAKTNPKPRRRAGVGAQGARKAYRMFNGRAPKKVTAVTVRKHTLPAGADYAKLGDLVKLITEKGEISFKTSERPMLVTDPQARALYFVGGSQNLSNVPAVKRVNPGRGMSDLGECLQIEYLGRKKFDGFQPVVYFHRFGEENGKRPRLMFDAQRKTMHLAGGDYKIKDVGIVN